MIQHILALLASIVLYVVAVELWLDGAVLSGFVAAMTASLIAVRAILDLAERSRS